MPIDDVYDQLPVFAKFAHCKMTDEELEQAESEYRAKSRPVGAMVLLSIVCPVQHFLLGRGGLGILFFATLLGFGIGYVVEWFKTPMRVKEYNAYVATRVISSIYYGRPIGRMFDLLPLAYEEKRLLRDLHESVSLTETSENPDVRKTAINIAIERAAAIPKMFQENSNVPPMEYLQDLRDEIHTDCVLNAVDDLINKAKSAKDAGAQVGYVGEAIAEIQGGLNDPCVLKDGLVEKQEYLKSLSVAFQVKELFENAERFEFKGDYEKAIDAYLDVMFFLKKNAAPGSDKERRIDELEDKVTQLRNILTGKTKGFNRMKDEVGVQGFLDALEPKL